MSISENRVKSLPFDTSKYILRNKEVTEFQRFWNSFKNSKGHQDKSMNIAISRFNFAYDRIHNEDKIIDYAISYEALFFKTKERFGNSDKLSKRVARLLENDFDKRKDLAEEVKRIYKIRNDIVHGNEVVIVDDFNKKVEKILRSSIKKFLERIETQTHDEIIDHLDFD